MFDDLFALSGKRREDYFQLVPLNPFYRIFDDQGRHFDYHRSVEANLAEIERWSPADRPGYERMTRHIREIFNVLHPYTYKPLNNLTTMLSLMPHIMRLLGMLDTHTFASAYVRSSFLRQVFSFHPLLVGGNPFGTPSLYTLIAQFEREWGVHYAIGGTGAIVQAIGKLLEELGGRIHLNAEVAEILVEGRRTTGIRMQDGTIHKAHAVVSNGDVASTYRYLIPSRYRRKYTDRKIDSMQYSMSLFVLYFGTKPRYTDSPLMHHNLILNADYRALMRDIFANRPVRDDFALYLHMPSRTDASISPEGCENLARFRKGLKTAKRTLQIE